MLDTPSDFSSTQHTTHFNDRSQRYAAYSDRMSGIGESLYSFVVDTGHPNGYEIHTLTEKAVIVIQNQRTGNVVTVLAARPGQVTRYWNLLGLRPPYDDEFDIVMRFAELNKTSGLNEL